MIRIEFTDGSYLDGYEINVVDYKNLIVDDFRYVDLLDIERIYEIEDDEDD